MSPSFSIKLFVVSFWLFVLLFSLLVVVLFVPLLVVVIPSVCKPSTVPVFTVCTSQFFSGSNVSPCAIFSAVNT